ncbi:MAG: hypothetical protein LWW81_05995 [Rhodocyclales bacterium]|nr:hypothetical protein [Rhodocyclales bacterium]
MNLLQSFLDTMVLNFLQLEPYQLVLVSLVIASVVPFLIFLVQRQPKLFARFSSDGWLVEPAIIGPVSLMFGLFAAFLANDIWGTNVAARNAVLQEADGVQAMLRYTEPLPDAEAKMMKNVLTTYVRKAIDNEWPKMRDGQVDPDAVDRLRAISNAIIIFEVGKSEGAVIQGRLLDAFNQIRVNWQTRTRIAQERQVTIKWHGVILFALLTQIAIGVVHFRRMRAMLVAQSIFGLAYALSTVLLFINEFPFSQLAPISAEPLARAYEALLR